MTDAARSRRAAKTARRGRASEQSDDSLPSSPGRRASLVAAGAAAIATIAVGGGFLGSWLWPSRSTETRGPEPKLYSFRVVRTYSHDPKAFTQGLLWLNGSLYESTGLYGRSTVRELKLTDSGDTKVVRRSKLNKEDFGEGLVHWRDGELLQLLWRKGEGIRYQVQAGPGGTLKKVPERFKTPLSDGWGLAFDGKSFLVTDSGHELIFLEPETLRLEKKVDITDNGVLVEMVNELEWIGNELWGNIFGNDCLARIDPESGAVTGWVSLEGILDRRQAEAEARAAGRDPPDILNGIAWDPEGQRLFVTGKLWPTLYEIEVTPASPSFNLQRARDVCIPKTNIFRMR